MSDIELVIVDSPTFLCVSLHHSPSLSGPSPFLVFSQSCVSSHENRQGLRGEDLGGLRGGGWTGRGGEGVKWGGWGVEGGTWGVVGAQGGGEGVEWPQKS